jgi:hypothetical protein
MQILYTCEEIQTAYGYSYNTPTHSYRHKAVTMVTSYYEYGHRRFMIWIIRIYIIFIHHHCYCDKYVLSN